MTVVLVVVSTVAWLLLAATAASMAETRRQSPALWFVIGLFFPILALVILAVAFDRGGASDPRELTLADAARRNPVARALGERAGSSVHRISEATSLPSKAVVGDLRTLRGMGLATRDDTGRWSLTDDGVEALGGSEPAGASGS